MNGTSVTTEKRRNGDKRKQIGLRVTSFLCFSVVTLVPLSPSAQNGSQFRDWTPSALGDSKQSGPHAACASLVSLTGYEFSIASATSVDASPDTPAYCHVLGVIPPEIRFEVNLPAAWNGRLYMFGNGGYAGEALNNPARQQAARRALTRGFTTAQTNTGHDEGVEPLGAFAANPQKFVDYAFRAYTGTGSTDDAANFTCRPGL